MLYLILSFIHVLSAVIWVGGMMFMTFAMMPVLRRPDYRDQARELLHLIGGRFRKLGHASLGLLLLTGLYLMHARGLLAFSEGAMKNPLTHVALTKLMGWVAIMVLSYLHDKRIGKRAMAIWREAPDSPEALKLRRLSMVIGRTNLLISLGMIVLGVMLVRPVWM